MGLRKTIITATTTSVVNADTADRLLDIHIRVCRQVTCHVTAKVLDSRQAHLVTGSKGSATTVVALYPSADN